MSEEATAKAPDNETAPRARPASADPLTSSRAVSRLAKHGYIAGLSGAVTVLGMGYLAAKRDAMAKGWGLLAGEASPHLTAAFALLVTASVMFAVEVGIRVRVDRGRILSIADELSLGRVRPFVARSVAIWAVDLGLMSIAFAVYRYATEYGFQRGGEYYKPWFAIMETLRSIYLWAGLPYVLVTRALQHDPNADRKQTAFAVFKAARKIRARFDKSVEAVAPFDRYDRSAMLGLGVKLFFVPVMTVFFSDQFTHLAKNWRFALDTIGNPEKPWSVTDFHNVAYTVIFSVDVALAWAGYVVSSRWIKNTLFSVEPTALGWVVALLSYPPINRVFGFYWSTPSESGFLQMHAPRAVFVLAVCSVASFCIYTSATICFGLRFSNLTHRGIITTGPYAWVRHPAYASKNVSGWCVMAPYAIHQAGGEITTTLVLELVGLLAMSGIYTLRALTEERHLKRDPEYVAYMAKVPYRFFPGIV